MVKTQLQTPKSSPTTAVFHGLWKKRLQIVFCWKISTQSSRKEFSHCFGWLLEYWASLDFTLFKA